MITLPPISPHLARIAAAWHMRRALSQAKALTARVATLEREIDAVRNELLHAVDALTPARRKRYDQERDERGGPLP